MCCPHNLGQFRTGGGFLCGHLPINCALLSRCPGGGAFSCPAGGGAGPGGLEHLPRYLGKRSSSCHASGGPLSTGGKGRKSAGAAAPDPILARGGATLASLQTLSPPRFGRAFSPLEAPASADFFARPGEPPPRRGILRQCRTSCHAVSRAALLW